jgi:uncharacterized membrane protein
MNSKFSTVGVVKPAPSMHGDLQLPLMMWGNTPTRKGSPHIRPPIHSRVVGLGATLLIGAFVTDVAYAQSELFQWENFSIWLITAGLALAAIAVIALIFDIVQHRIIAIDWPRFCGFTGAVILSVLNAFVHSRDAYTAVIPQGVALSGIVAAILPVLGWRHGWSVGEARQSLSQTEGTHS